MHAPYLITTLHDTTNGDLVGRARHLKNHLLASKVMPNFCPWRSCIRGPYIQYTAIPNRCDSNGGAIHCVYAVLNSSIDLELLFESAFGSLSDDRNVIARMIDDMRHFANTVSKEFYLLLPNTPM